jgi:glycosyltransferase involved in cell wall biosynthesis
MRARLLVAGSGAELRAWQARAAQTAEVSGRISFLGYRTDVPSLVAAADVLVHPARYEAYGLAVHEALCCGVPAIAPVSAGIAEQFPDYLRPLLVEDVDSATEVSNRLRKWRDESQRFRERAIRFSGTLRARTWDDMAREFAGLVES